MYDALIPHQQLHKIINISEIYSDIYIYIHVFIYVLNLEIPLTHLSNKPNPC
jgi:hypothetical protein